MTATQTLAAIDCGTNTIRLLVAELAAGGTMKPLLRAEDITRLGEGFGADKLLQEAPMARSVAVLADFAKQARAAGASAVQVYATSVARRAENAEAFLDRVRAAADVDINIISGGFEAELTARGVFLSGKAEGPSLIADIGGGSTEIQACAEGKVLASISIEELGVVALTEALPVGDPPDPLKIFKLSERIDSMIEAPVRRWREEGHWRTVGGGRLYGTAGTVTTLAALHLGLPEYDREAVDGAVLSHDQVLKQFSRLSAMSLKTRSTLPALDPRRADLIVAGACILDRIMRRFACSELIVSENGLIEGAVIAMAEATPDPSAG